MCIYKRKFRLGSYKSDTDVIIINPQVKLFRIQMLM